MTAGLLTTVPTSVVAVHRYSPSFVHVTASADVTDDAVAEEEEEEE
jgi:hypothetical protein